MYGGDSYELIIEAFDPKNREIEYEVSSISRGLEIIQKNSVFNFIIPEHLIANTITLSIIAITPKSEYQNQASFQIVYTIIPQS